MSESSTSVILSGLKCRSCRFVLFDNENLFKAHNTEKMSFIKSRSRSFSSAECSHYFLNEDAILANSLKWIEDQIQTGAQEGPINCGKCSHKLGTFNWKGTQCACGAWQIPAIGIIKSKVDPIKHVGADTDVETRDSVIL